MKRCLMITGGVLSLPFARDFIKERTYDLVIAVDAGLSYAGELGIHADVAVGDFDTLGSEKLSEYKKDKSLSMDIHRPEKDETDTELAFRTAFSRGCTSVDVLGATGGRLDHEVSNIHLLVQGMKKGMDISIYDRQNRIYLLDASRQNSRFYEKSKVYGSYVSFLPLTEEVKGITLTGFKYPLFKKDISILENPSLCVSNEVMEETAEISFDQGILICVESRD